MYRTALGLKFLEALALVLLLALLSGWSSQFNGLFALTIGPIAAISMLYLVYMYLPVQVGLAILLKTRPRILVCILTALGVLHIGAVEYGLFSQDAELLSRAIVFTLAAAPVLLLVNIAISGLAIERQKL
jgi:small-conductance mechanosensitive channel